MSVFHFKNKHMEEETKKPEMEKCVLCGKETQYPRHMHIDFRENYVEGVGQLCTECANKIYNDRA